MGCIIWFSLSILFSLSFSKRQREEKRMEVKLPKMQPSFLSLFYNSLSIFTLLIDCWCVPRDQLHCITGTEAFHDVLLALVGRGPTVLSSDFLGLELPHSIQVWHWGSISCCYDPMPGALWSCRFSVLCTEPFCAKTTLEFNWKSQTSLCGQCILVCYQRRLKPDVTWLSFPCLFCWAVAFRLPQVPTKISEEEQFIKFPWLGL